MQALAAALVTLGLAMLNRTLKERIDALPSTEDEKQELRRIEEETIALLRDALKKTSPRVLKLLAKAIPNDPTTGWWA